MWKNGLAETMYLRCFTLGTLLWVVKGSTSGSSGAGSPYTHETFLDGDKSFKLSWLYNDTHIQMRAQVKTKGWLSVGLSPDGNMDDTDAWVAFVNDTTGQVYLSDRYLTTNTTIHKVFFDVDPQQDWMLLFGTQTADETIIEVARPLTTCDTKMDRPFTRDTLRVIWACHSQDPAMFDKNGQPVIVHHQRRGSKSLVVFSDAYAITQNSTGGNNSMQRIFIQMDPVTMDNNTDSLVQCKQTKLPTFTKKMQIVSVQPMIQSDPNSKGAVQRILIYLCDSPGIPENTTESSYGCGADLPPPSLKDFCRRLIAVWTAGSEEYRYPNDAGLPLSPANSGQFVLMETVYRNVKKTAVQDSSGLVLTLTDALRPHDAAFLSTGLLNTDYQITIPPHVDRFVVTSHCMDFCTQSTLPATGINIFSTFFNTHDKGRQVFLHQIRDGKELNMVNSDNNFDPLYQEARSPAQTVILLPGDRLILECQFNSAKQKSASFGGYGTDDEVCMGFLNYYPAVNLTTCGSMVNAQKLLQTTEYVPITSDSKSPGMEESLGSEHNAAIRTYLSTKYNWNTQNIARLQQFYLSEDQLGICLDGRSDMLKYSHLGNFTRFSPKADTCISPRGIVLPPSEIVKSGPAMPKMTNVRIAIVNASASTPPSSGCDMISFSAILILSAVVLALLRLQ